MSDLREAHDRIHHFMRGWDQGEVISGSVTAEGQAVLRYADLGLLLDAAHPVEPAGCAACISGDTENCTCFAVPAQVEITDKAVEAARSAREAAVRSIDRASDGTDWPDPMRAALAAALPYLVPRPLLDREALGAVLLSFGADVRLDSGRPAEMLGLAVDAVLELVRPMPTRQQIATVLHDGTHGRLQCSGPNCYIWDESYKSADLVLSLLGGES